MTADPRARRVLREYRNATAMPPAARGALWDRIDRSIDEGTELEAPVEARERPRRAAVWLAVVLGSSTVLVVGLVPRLWPLPEPPAPVVSPTPAPEPPSSSRRLRADRPSPTAAVAADAPQIPSVAESGPPPRTERAPTRARAGEAEAAAPAPAPEEALREEMLLIAQARGALQKGQPTAALGVLEDHLRRFPKGQMREDRAVLRIEALCAVGKTRQANIEVEAFTRTFAGSAHLGRVRALCPKGQPIPTAAEG